MIPPLAGVVLAVAATLSHHAVPDRPPHAVVQQAPRPSGTALHGTATWYSRVPGGAAAGPGLRRVLGKGWRGKIVTVCATRCVKVRLDDWCLCSKGGRLVDLAAGDFAKIAALSRGVVKVDVRY